MKHSAYLIIAKKIGLFSIARWLTRRKIRILGYHGIWFSKGHYGNYLFMSPQLFSDRMDWLRKSQYNVIPLNDAINHLRSNAIKPLSVAITIDDGWHGTYSHMLPILEKNSFPATLYAYTGAISSQQPLLHIMLPALLNNTHLEEISFTDPISKHSHKLHLRRPEDKKHATNIVLDIYWSLNEKDRMSFCHTIAESLSIDYDDIKSSRQFSFMSYEELSDASRRGIDVQLHTNSHKLDMDNPESITLELELNRDNLLPYVANDLQHFCYPGGLYTTDMFQYLERCHIVSAVTTDIGLVDSKSPPFQLNRILDGQQISFIEFEAELSGFMEIARQAKGLASRLIFR